MNCRNKKEINHLITLFEAGRLPKSEWTHHAHITVGFSYLWKNDFPASLQRIRKNIIAYNQCTGVPNTDSRGYHETITRFWLLTIENYLSQKDWPSLPEAVNEFMKSDYSKLEYMLRFYAKETLFSVKARRQWVEPDIKPITL